MVEQVDRTYSDTKVQAFMYLVILVDPHVVKPGARALDYVDTRVAKSSDAGRRHYETGRVEPVEYCPLGGGEVSVANPIGTP